MAGVKRHLQNTLDAATPVEHPRENLIRALSEEGPGRTLVRSNGKGPPTLTGHFAVFNEWTEINSFFEGNFLERISPGAFAKTFQEQGDRIRCLLEHGMDWRAGNRPLGKPESLSEDDIGAAYDVPLFDDADYVSELLPAFRAGQYGASFRFRVIREEWIDEPDPSDYNPKGLPERTIKEMSVAEFGPVTFPAYASATAGLRSVSLTDRLHPELTRNGNGAMRVDADDASCLAQMLEIGAYFLDAQDATDDADDIASMTGVMDTLVSLVSKEIHEDDPDGDDADESDQQNSGRSKAAREKGRAATARARKKLASQDGAGTTSHPSRGSRDTTHLYLGSGRKETPSWRL